MVSSAVLMVQTNRSHMLGKAGKILDGGHLHEPVHQDAFERFTDATSDGVLCTMMGVWVRTGEDLRRLARAGFWLQAQWSLLLHTLAREKKGSQADFFQHNRNPRTAREHE